MHKAASELRRAGCGALDRPDTTSVILESGEGMGPWGARAIGEPALVPTAPTVANAVCDAVGVRMTRVPVTPERLWRALQEREACPARP